MNGRIAIIVLGLVTNNTEVALFTVAERIMTLLALALYATNYALGPQFARLYTQGNWRQLQLITTWGARGVLLVASIAGLVFFVFADTILAFFGTEFVAARPTLIILIIGQLFNAFTGSVTILLTTTYHERETTRAVVVSAILNLIASAMLIPAYGAVGAALASTFSIVYWNVHLVIYARRRLGIDTTALGIFSKKWTGVP
jgi:O-antigen/teichoic acid export membrane protein